MSERFSDEVLQRALYAYARAGLAVMRAVLEGHLVYDNVWIVTEFDSRRIRGVFRSQADAEAGIAAISAEHPDLTRADFVIEVQRVRAIGAASDGSPR